MNRAWRSLASLLVALLMLPGRPIWATESGKVQSEPVKPKKDHSIPNYLQKRPAWGVQLSGAWTGALGSTATLGGLSARSAQATELTLEYQPRWIQKLGVIALGGHLRHHLGVSAKRITGYGAQISYQAKWLARQWVVPVVGYSFDQINYSLTNGPTGTLPNPGVYYGLRIFLTATDPDAAAEFYTGYGVLRTYLTLETTQRSAQDAWISLAGRSTSVGMRIEL